MCTLRFYSDTHSFRDLENMDSLAIHRISEKGELRSKRSNTVYQSFQMTMDASTAGWDEFPKQTREVIGFLKRNFALLGAILKSHEVESAGLDFPIWSRLDGNIVNQNDHFPPELIQLAGQLGLGISMSSYAPSAFDSGDLKSKDPSTIGRELPP